jgi:hypothetical protein
MEIEVIKWVKVIAASLQEKDLSPAVPVIDAFTL